MKVAKWAFRSVLAVLIGVAGLWWWSDRQNYESTNNAYVEADIVMLSPRVSGFVNKVLVQQNDEVTVGQPVALIETEDFRLQLASALAKRDEARAALGQVGGRRAEREALFRETTAALSGAEAGRSAAANDRDRLEQLAKQGWITKRLLQSSIADAEKAAASVQAARAAIAAEAARSRTLSAEGDELAARLASANAELKRTRLDLDRTALRSPVAGIVGPVAAHAGELVKPGDLMMHIVPTRQRHIIANFKETQVRRLRLGQSVRVTLDAFPERELQGTVQSLSPATGSRFAALPIDNANGNWIKIVQRLPVRITITPLKDADHLLRPGLSAAVRVDVRSAR